MLQAFTRPRAALLSAMAAVAVLAACSTAEPPPPPAPPPPPPPPIALNSGVAEAASVYVSFMREVSAIRAGFTDPEAIQAAIRRGAAYQPEQLSRGLIAYGAILALQSPEFVEGMRTYAVDPVQRQEIVNRIVADPAYAATFPGANAAAGLIIATLDQDAEALALIADAVENDAYTIQERNDPRRRWAVTHLTNREERLEAAKTLSTATMLPSAEESAQLLAAAHAGTGLDVVSSTRSPPYTPAVVRSLAIAALAALGSAGDNARLNTEALTTETGNQFCLNMSKLMLYQCLAASRPSYEDMFCVGRHIVRDLASCTTDSIKPRSIISVGDPESAGPANIAAQSPAAEAATDEAVAPTSVAVTAPITVEVPVQSPAGLN